MFEQYYDKNYRCHKATPYDIAKQKFYTTKPNEVREIFNKISSTNIKDIKRTATENKLDSSRVASSQKSNISDIEYAIREHISGSWTEASLTYLTILYGYISYPELRDFISQQKHEIDTSNVFHSRFD